ncbi:AAA family ATPase, partial [Methylobacterium sp. Leaf118]|uniref:AAA family ATPase n=1 Tax=Methylobacterium sp. Leaf118 TaxID=2876562 RepID=UPI001E56727D
MRILAIRGENLASLAEPFAIDLAEGPIALTGLFAITGETGAGKSTILDALCLALYGQYPRVSVGRREEVPDPSGQALAASDGRVILRRGAGQGYAEVDFLAQDGIAYRARWAANRARLRAQGRLQADTRTLTRIADGQAVASGKSAVAAAVEARTDLTFDQFRRTVVLAQGEFDAFLLAGEAERADLLEKITGTEIYSAVSRQVHAGAGAERAAVGLLDARHAAIGLLAEEARAAMRTERASTVDTLPALEAEHAALRAALDLAGRRAVSALRRDEAEAALAAAEAVIASAGPEAARLAALDAVEPLRRPAEAFAAAEASAAAAEGLLAMADGESHEAERAREAAEAGFAQAHGADEAASAEFDAFTPLWREADRLDTRITDCRSQADAAQARARTAAETAERAEAAAARAENQRSQSLAARDGLARELDDGAMAAPLADRAEEIAGLFAKHAALSEALRTARDGLAAAETGVAAAEAAMAEARLRADVARATRLRHAAARDALAAERAGLDEDGARLRSEHLAAVADPLAETADLARRYGEAASEQARAEAAAETAEADRKRAGERRTVSERAREAAARARGEIAVLAELAESSLSREAARLRSLLVAGEPCPVCGGREHPHRHDDCALSQLAETMRTRRAALDAELAGADRASREAAAAEAQASARLEAARREGARA